MWLILGDPVRPVRLIVGSLVTAALAAASWIGWLGWLYWGEYEEDPLTGAEDGLLVMWPLVGCVLSLVAVLVGALVADVPPVPAAAAWIVGFAVPWTMEAAARDVTGLYVVGLVLLVGGMAMAAALITAIVTWLRGALARRRRR